MTGPPTPDVVLTEQPDGGTRYRLPNLENLLLLYLLLATFIGCFLLGAAINLSILVGFACSLLGFLIVICCPMDWFFFTEHREILLTADMLEVMRRIGPF